MEKKLTLLVAMLSIASYGFGSGFANPDKDSSLITVLDIRSESTNKNQNDSSSSFAGSKLSFVVSEDSGISTKVVYGKAVDATTEKQARGLKRFICCKK